MYFGVWPVAGEMFDQRLASVMLVSQILTRPLMTAEELLDEDQGLIST